MLSLIIAEDDPAMRYVLNKTLSQIPGVEVLGEAGDGITALKMVEELNPRVVFIDIDLPGKNGYEITFSDTRQTAIWPPKPGNWKK